MEKLKYIKWTVYETLKRDNTGDRMHVENDNKWTVVHERFCSRRKEPWRKWQMQGRIKSRVDKTARRQPWNGHNIGYMPMSNGQYIMVKEANLETPNGNQDSTDSQNQVHFCSKQCTRQNWQDFLLLHTKYII